MSPILFTMPGNEEFGTQLLPFLPCSLGDMQISRSEQGEPHPRFFTPVAGRDIIFACTLNHAHNEILALYLGACVARELGARNIGFVIPYLPYGWRDGGFKDGQGSVALHFARLISSCCDWLVTVDSHQEAQGNNSKLFSIPNRMVLATQEIGNWIGANVVQPIIFGTDAANEYWIARVAAAANCPYTMLRTEAISADEVEVSIPDAAFWVGMNPVLLDGMAPNIHMLIAAAVQIKLARLPSPVCITPHALFSSQAYSALQASGIDRVVSCNTITHLTNRINLCKPIALGIIELTKQKDSSEKPPIRVN